MSFRSVPIIEQPIHKSVCEKSENLDQKARDYFDRFHLLPRFLRFRELATRSGNPFNKRITTPGKVKIVYELENEPDSQQFVPRRQQNKSDVNIRSVMVFLQALTPQNNVSRLASFTCKDTIPLTRIVQQRFQLPEITLGKA